MCNFVLRPIKSYATVDIENVKRGEAYTVESVDEDGKVSLRADDGKTALIPIAGFVHAFTADPAEVKKAKEEEAKWFPKAESK